MPIYVANDLRSIALPAYPPSALPTHITVTFAEDQTVVRGDRGVGGARIGSDGSPRVTGPATRCTLLTSDVWREIIEQCDAIDAAWERGEIGEGRAWNGVDEAKYRVMVERVLRIEWLLARERERA